MIEFWNVVIAVVAGVIVGAAIHSAYVHCKERGDLQPFPWDHDLDDERDGEDGEEG